MIFKYVGVPYGLLVVLAGAGGLSLPSYFAPLASSDTWKHNFNFALLFGIFFAPLVGFFVDKLGHQVSLALATLLTLITYPLLARYTTDAQIADENNKVVCLLLFLAGQGLSLAILSAFKLNLKNHPQAVAFILCALVISYVRFAPEFEQSFRNTLFKNQTTKAYLTIAGVLSALIFAGGIAALKEVEQQGGAGEFLLAQVDKMGLMVFVVVAAIFGLFIFIFGFVKAKWSTTVAFSVLLVLINVLVPVLNMKVVMEKAKDMLKGVKPSMSDLAKMGKGGEDSSCATGLFRPKFFLLLVGYVVLFGFSSMFIDNLPKITAAVSGASDKTSRSANWFYFCDFVGRLGGGVMIGLLGSKVSSYLWGVIFGGCVTLGVIFTVLATQSGGMLFLAADLLGFGMGGLFVLMPIVVLEDNGASSWTSIYGTVGAGAILGWWGFGYKFFDFFFNKALDPTAPESFQKSFGIGIAFSIAAVILMGVAYSIDKKEDEKKEGGVLGKLPF